MSDLYAHVASPPPPPFPEEAIIAQNDRDTFARLMNYEEPPGIATRMYSYQFVSCYNLVPHVSMLIHLSARSPVCCRWRCLPLPWSTPSSPPLTKSEGMGDTTSTSVHGISSGILLSISSRPAASCESRRNIDESPALTQRRCEQMGVGKTLMCLALIVATLHQPTQPPKVSLGDNSPFTRHAVETYPFDRYREAREALSYPEGLTQLQLPSLVDLCSNILVGRDHSAARRDFVPPVLSDRLAQPTFYYEVPLENDCVRKAKKVAQQRYTRQTYLANTTLVVVPQILLGQWKDEVQKACNGWRVKCNGDHHQVST